MAGPPNDVVPSELWRKLSETPKPSEVIDFPRRDMRGRPIDRIRIQVLTMSEHDEARLRAHNWLKDRGIPTEEFDGPTIREVYGDAVARELLAMACVTEDPVKGTEERSVPLYGRLFRTGKDLEILTADEVLVLFTAYEMAQHKYGPYEGSIRSDDDVNAWTKRLVEGASAFPLAQRNWHQLVELIMSLSERAYCLSVLLESQLSTLPPTLKQPLEDWGIGTSFFGERHARKIIDGWIPSSSDDDDDEIDVDAEVDELENLIDPLERPPSDQPITIEQAARLAENLHKQGRGDDNA